MPDPHGEPDTQSQHPERAPTVGRASDIPSGTGTAPREATLFERFRQELLGTPGGPIALYSQRHIPDMEGPESDDSETGTSPPHHNASGPLNWRAYHTTLNAGSLPWERTTGTVSRSTRPGSNGENKAFRAEREAGAPFVQVATRPGMADATANEIPSGAMATTENQELQAGIAGDTSDAFSRPIGSTELCNLSDLSERYFPLHQGHLPILAIYHPSHPAPEFIDEQTDIGGTEKATSNGTTRVALYAPGLAGDDRSKQAEALYELGVRVRNGLQADHDRRGSANNSSQGYLASLIASALSTFLQSSQDKPPASRVTSGPEYSKMMGKALDDALLATPASNSSSTTPSWDISESRLPPLFGVVALGGENQPVLAYPIEGSFVSGATSVRGERSVPDRPPLPSTSRYDTR